MSTHGKPASILWRWNFECKCPSTWLSFKCAVHYLSKILTYENLRHLTSTLIDEMIYHHTVQRSQLLINNHFNGLHSHKLRWHLTVSQKRSPNYGSGVESEHTISGVWKWNPVMITTMIAGMENHAGAKLCFSFHPSYIWVTLNQFPV